MKTRNDYRKILLTALVSALMFTSANAAKPADAGKKAGEVTVAEREERVRETREERERAEEEGERAMKQAREEARKKEKEAEKAAENAKEAAGEEAEEAEKAAKEGTVAGQEKAKDQAAKKAGTPADKTDAERKELGKGSETGQAKRAENSRKWWKFWGD